MFKYPLIVLALAGLAGCAAHSGVLAVGQDRFMIAKQAPTGFSGLGALPAEIRAEANDYCGRTGKHAKVVDSTQTEPPYILGNYPRAEVQFQCE